MRAFGYLTCVLMSVGFVLGQADCPSSLTPLPPLPLPAVIPPPVASCDTPVPDSIAGYMPFTFVNNTGIDDENIYLVVLVNSSQQYLSFSGSTHKLATISEFTKTTYLSSPSYTYQLSDFQNDDGSYTFYIPNDGNTDVPGSNVMKSSRILISLYEPLTYFINDSGVLQIPSEFDVKNDNYFILNDKIEFDVGSNGHNRMNLNLTWVDYFGLPMSVQANYQYFYGSSYTNACSVTGLPSDVSYLDMYTGYLNALNSLSSPFKEDWNGLVATYLNPANIGFFGGSEEVCYLRIFAPATAMGSTSTQLNPSTVSFPTNYFLSSIDSPDTCTWFNAVWKGKTLSGDQAFYQNQKPKPAYIVVDAGTADGAATATGSEQSDGSFKFLITGGGDAGKNISFPLPTSSKAFFTGAVSDYTPAITGNASIASQNQILKVFATSIISGLFPINCHTKPPITITSQYLQDQLIILQIIQHLQIH